MLRSPCGHRPMTCVANAVMISELATGQCCQPSAYIEMVVLVADQFKLALIRAWTTSSLITFLFGANPSDHRQRRCWNFWTVWVGGFRTSKLPAKFFESQWILLVCSVDPVLTSDGYVWDPYLSVPLNGYSEDPYPGCIQALSLLI